MSYVQDSNKRRDRIASLWGLAEKISNELKKDPRIVAIWAFGSLARGEADEFSDLDMAAYVEEDKFKEFMRESREEMWKSKLAAHPDLESQSSSVKVVPPAHSR